MSFLFKVAKAMAAKNKPMSWTSPSGLPISNRYHKLKTKRVEIPGGRKPYKHRIVVGTEKTVDREKAPRSAPANFTHSFDASHMAFVTNAAVKEGIVDLAMVHDLFGCPAAQAGPFRDIIREEFVRMYEENKNVLADIREAAARELGTDSGLPEVPRGTFDLQEVRRSEFPFDP